MPAVKSEGPLAPAPPASDGGITIHNCLHPGHPYQAAVDGVCRVALRGLSGPWDVSVYPVGRAWFRIDVVAPDGASWSMSVPAHEGPRGEDLADTVRAACVRHCCLRPENRKRRADGGPKAGSHQGGVASGPSPAPGGTPK